MKSYRYSSAGTSASRFISSRGRRRLATALSVALLSHGAAGIASVDQPHIPQPLVVQNCNDSGPSSLRDIILNQAQSGGSSIFVSFPHCAETMACLF
jgi:hypothetical protein